MRRVTVRSSPSRCYGCTTCADIDDGFAQELGVKSSSRSAATACPYSRFLDGKNQILDLLQMVS
jgi:hypothetical protein